MKTLPATPLPLLELPTNAFELSARLPSFNCTDPLAPPPNDLAETPVSVPADPTIFNFCAAINMSPPDPPPPVLVLAAEIRAPPIRLTTPACTCTSPPLPGAIGTIAAGGTSTVRNERLLPEPSGFGSGFGTSGELTVTPPVVSDQLLSVAISLRIGSLRTSTQRPLKVLPSKAASGLRGRKRPVNGAAPAAIDVDASSANTVFRKFWPVPPTPLKRSTSVPSGPNNATSRFSSEVWSILRETLS